ncbi:DUF1707 domain-containing protein [Streptomyces boncukensis]|uniref:DUF1707 SHOCT-like domain-containing protein n=1 Tax=Streptomyces boncukensis TaxID=2711219 RepID=UPI0030B9E03F
MPEKPPPRISESVRDSAVARLQEAFAAGSIPADEMDHRLQTALTATTDEELAAALDAVPGAEAATPAATVEIRAVGGRIRRQGAWRVPRVLRIESRMAKVVLDLSRTAVEHPVVDIELQLEFGGARLILPPGATVDYDGLTAHWKQPVHRAPRWTEPGGPHIRVTGTMGYGRLRIRHRSRA